MDAELKAKWLAALRSGKYEQGQGCLRNSQNRYCCLGVLADVHAPAHWLNLAGGVFAHDNGVHFHETKYGPDEDLISPHDTERLMSMNDSGDTFAEIADYIEANL